jgi:redox-sensitive bicupin YhaK (pirin superfamily)
MPVLAVRSSEVAHPTGDPNFSVMQPFPAAFTAEESDPFLMCDSFGPAVSKGIETDPDKFQVAWHPHRGMDILTYLTEGVGRHADSLGNRGNFASPGMQWISVVSVVVLCFILLVVNQLLSVD